MAAPRSMHSCCRIGPPGGAKGGPRPGAGGAQLVGGPEAEDGDPAGQEDEYRHRRPPPGASLGDGHQHGNQADGQKSSPGGVQPMGAEMRARRQDDEGAQEGEGGDACAEPVGGRQSAGIGEQAGQRIADARAGNGRHRQESDHRPRLLRRQTIPCGRHGQWDEPQAGPLERPADDQDDEARSDGRDRSADGDDGERRVEVVITRTGPNKVSFHPWDVTGAPRGGSRSAGCVVRPHSSGSCFPCRRDTTGPGAQGAAPGSWSGCIGRPGTEDRRSDGRGAIRVGPDRTTLNDHGGGVQG